MKTLIKLLIFSVFNLKLVIALSQSPTVALDSTFKNNTTFNSDVMGTVIQPDGKIIVYGAFTKYKTFNRNRIARLHPNGDLDTTFKTILGPNIEINAVDVQHDGKIIIGGFFSSYDGIPLKRIARLNTDGSVDTSFKVGTGIEGNLFLNKAGIVYCIKVLANGKILVGGDFENYNGQPFNKIGRLNPDGTKDNTFSSQIVYDYIGSNGGIPTIHEILIQPDNKIVVGGYMKYHGSGYLSRLLENGANDISFHAQNSLFYTVVHALALQKDGKILVGGATTPVEPNLDRKYFRRMNQDGTEDLSFRTEIAGILIPPREVHAIELFGDSSRILIGGTFEQIDSRSSYRLARLHLSGKIDTTFNVGLGYNNFVYSIHTQQDGRIIVGGRFSKYHNDSTSFLCRLNNIPTCDPPTVSGKKSYCGLEPFDPITANGTGIKWYSDSNLTTLVGTGLSYTPSVQGKIYCTQTLNTCTSPPQIIEIKVHTLPILNFNLLTSYNDTTSQVILSGIPSGGVFNGSGVTGNILSPASIGSGNISISYSYTDPFTLCSNTLTKGTLILPALTSTIIDMGIRNIICYPNPAREYIDCEIFTNIGTMINIELIGNNGHKITLKLNQELHTGLNQLKIPIQNFSLTPGQYTLRVYTQGQDKIFKLLLE